MLIKIILLIIAGLLGGTLGGMGMGGGTLLIPLLTIMCNVPQHTAQAINLVTFVPMAIAALIIHIKNNAVDFKGVWLIIVPACAVATGGAFLSSLIKAEIMSRLFGGFLAILGIVQLTAEIVSIIKAKRKKKENALHPTPPQPSD